MRDEWLGVIGAHGRLGSRVVAEAGRRGVPVVLAATSSSWEHENAPSVVVDASRASALHQVAEFCAESKAALVSCVSGLDSAGDATLRELAEIVPVVRAVNLSLGHWVQAHLLQRAAQLVRAMPEKPGAAVLERHTTAKRDRPSATAKALAAMWGDVTEIASYRSGLPVSEHRVDLTFTGESLSLHHDVRDLGAAVHGVFVAVEWARSATTGFVTIRELFDQAFIQENR
ncbi:MAG: dihydrodipicolinate reductase C-terminal domain-containing protein [Kibdelosporangium sp.]